MKTKPELGITNPYALDETQLRGGQDLLKTQKTLVSKYWGTAQEEIDGFANGDMVDRHGLAVPGEHDQRRQRQEGRGGQAQGRRDGLVRHLDDLVEGQAPELHVQVDGLHHLAQGERGRDRVLRRGAASATRPAPRQRSSRPGHCDLFHAKDESYFADVYYWNTPDEDVPRRPRRHLHRLRRLDEGVDRGDRRLTGRRPIDRTDPRRPAAGGLVSAATPQSDRRRSMTAPPDPSPRAARAPAAGGLRALSARSTAIRGPSSGCSSRRRSAGSSSPISGRSRCS